MAKKKGKKNDEIKENRKGEKENRKGDNIVPKIAFYTKERWQNWIDQVKECNFKIEDQDKCAIFVSMTDDVILACLKVIAKHDKGILKKDDAIKYLSEIKEIVLKKVDQINDDTDIMLESTQLSLMGVFVSCERYINKTFERIRSFDKLIKDAIQAEEKNDMGTALDYISTIGANVLAGDMLSDKDIDNITFEGLVAEWLDGIDSLGVAMMGDTSYKDDEPDED